MCILLSGFSTGKLLTACFVGRQPFVTLSLRACCFSTSNHMRTILAKIITLFSLFMCLRAVSLQQPKPALQCARLCPCTPRQALSPLPGLLWLATLSHTYEKTCLSLHYMILNEGEALRFAVMLQLCLFLPDLSQRFHRKPSCREAYTCIVSAAEGVCWQCNNELTLMSPS